MKPTKVVRDRIWTLTDLPNVGPAVAADLHRLGIDSPEQLKGRDAFALYDQLCSITGRRQDPCVIDVFLGGLQNEVQHPEFVRVCAWENTTAS